MAIRAFVVARHNDKKTPHETEEKMAVAARREDSVCINVVRE